LSRGSVAQAGLRSQLQTMQSERLVTASQDGRIRPGVVKSWTTTPDQLTWTFTINDGVRFHNGKPLTADVLTRILGDRLPAAMGRFSDDIATIQPIGNDRVEVVLKRRSTLFLESLDFEVVDAESSPTGAYRIAPQDGGEWTLIANRDYWGGTPEIDRILFKEYGSVRGAWADMLRGELDMLFEVGGDALESLQGAGNVQLFSYQRRYAFEILLNVRHPGLHSAEVRRRLNAAIDRRVLVDEGLGGHGRPEDSPVWIDHWANSPELPTFRYHPVPLDQPLTLHCIFPDPAFERLALLVQRQLSVIGVDLKLELVPLDEWVQRWESGNFEVLLGDIINGSTVSRMHIQWSTGGARNFTHYTNPTLDRAVDQIHDAEDDDAFRRGFAAFEHSLIDDPPAIFLAWAERARAVSTRFDVPADPARDVINTIRFWQLRPPSRPLTH
jgi:peptide/nickel transport system substrate-binding protein